AITHIKEHRTRIKRTVIENKSRKLTPQTLIEKMLFRRKRAVEAKGKMRVEIYALIYDGENSSANSYVV
ncbi:MAG: hypothetical protein WBF08_01490, partial [Candidatus Bathyarchaeia archaeon]